MAMTVRLPADLDRELEALAAARHVSKHALLVQGAQLIVDRQQRSADIDSAVDFVIANDAALLTRLEDA